ncbi:MULTISPECIES: MFS transporter [Arthrobacter]|uniref:MFS transporter n=2 Tax=Arthrobacter TaxID=1663 RepID=A0ABU9KQY4_9MICC|nr:MFS transporter [Arthrobacter sp. YJM1]MDP5228569.1 MFS transporter [Arthrobacter sp. YJM1]
MSIPSIPGELRRARLATIAEFFVAGLALAAWVVSIPSIQQRTGVSHATLGSLLLLLGLGSFLGMTLTGPLIDRIGSRRAIILSALVLVIGVNLPGLATDPWGLGAALFVLGLGSGSIDVAMNDQAVLVERAYGRPIMSSLHAYFSIGGGAGALLGAGTQALGSPANVTLAIGAGVTAVLTLVAYPALLRTSRPPAETLPETVGAALTGRARTRTITVLAALAFLIMLSEGTANDWSALHAVEHFGLPQSAASLAYGAFAIAMTAGRFGADRIVHRFGPVAVVRSGSVLAAVGMAAVVLSPAYPVTLAGWAAFGLGLSGIVPQLFTAAGRLGGAQQGVVMSRIVGAGYLGLLAGPAIIGWASQAAGLTLALFLPIACCAAGLLLAARVSIPEPTAPRQRVGADQ